MKSEIVLKEEKVNPVFEEIRNLINRSRERASYGNAVLEQLLKKLTKEFGKGFSSRDLRTMRKFYITYPIWKTVSSKLSWSHYLELIKIEKEPKRSLYLKESIDANWSVRELQRQKHLCSMKDWLYPKIKKHHDRDVKSKEKNETVVKYTLLEEDDSILLPNINYIYQRKKTS